MPGLHQSLPADLLNAGWFYCLMFVPLYSRPVVIEMLREHVLKALKHALEIYNFEFVITKDDFAENLQYLVKNQLTMILNTRNSPSVMRGGILLERALGQGFFWFQRPSGMGKAIQDQLALFLCPSCEAPGNTESWRNSAYLFYVTLLLYQLLSLTSLSSTL